MIIEIFKIDLELVKFLLISSHKKKTKKVEFKKIKNRKSLKNNVFLLITHD